MKYDLPDANKGYGEKQSRIRGKEQTEEQRDQAGRTAHMKAPRQHMLGRSRARQRGPQGWGTKRQVLGNELRQGPLCSVEVLEVLFAE